MIGKTERAVPQWIVQYVTCIQLSIYMKPTVKFRMASFGLNENEQALLAQQLKMLKGRTGALWSYSTESEGADVSLEHLAQDDVAIAYIANSKEGMPKRLQTQWPLRLFGLIELLQQCEQAIGLESNAVTSSSSEVEKNNSQPSTSVASIHAVNSHSEAVRGSFSKQLSNLRDPAAFSYADFHALVCPSTDQLQTNIADFDQLVELIKATPTDTPIVREDNLSTANYSFAYSLKRVLWSVALTENSPANPSWFKPNSEFRIGAWPLLNEWQSSPALMRLTALFTRQYASLEQAASFTQLSQAEIIAFLQACDICGLMLQHRQMHANSVTQESAPQSKKPESSTVTKEQPKGLLGRLRARLGLTFGRAS